MERPENPMHLERAHLTPEVAEAVFSSKTTCQGHFEASITRWVPSPDDPGESAAVVAAREFAKVAERHGLVVQEIFRVELADSAATFLTFTIAVRATVQPTAGLLALHDLTPPRFLGRGDAHERDGRLEFAVEASRDTSAARAAWVAVLAAPPSLLDPGIPDRVFRDLERTAAATLGGVVAPGSVPHESARPTRGKPQMGGAAPETPMESAAPPSPPPPPPPPAPAPVEAAPPLSRGPAASPPAPSPAPATPARRTRSRSRAPRTDQGEGLAALRVSRRPEIEFKDTVAAGARVPLTLTLHEENILDAVPDAFAVVIEKGKASVTLTVSLSAPGFIVEPREQPITIGRSYDAKAERVTFMLTAQEPTGGEPVERDLRADIWSGNAAIGGVTFLTTVTPRGWKARVKGGGKSRSVPFDTTQAGRECDFVLRVEGRDEHGTPPFQLSARIRIPGEPEVESKRLGSMSFTRTELSSMLNDQFASFAERFPADGDAAKLKAWRADLLDEVDTLGKWLWTRLPDEFRDEYFRLLDAKRPPASMLVHSDEMLIPWELVVPHRQGKVLPRLGVAHVMGRWRPALGMRPRPQALTITGATIANPKYQDAGFLIWSLLEAADLTKAVPAFTRMPTVDKASMKKMLDRTDVQLLHFTGHGKYAKHADLSTLILENGDTITAMHFIGSKLLEKGHPIIYLNACEVGTSGVTMGQMGGFAAQCVEGGCSGIVAPYWAVADDSAREFAVAFYGQLKGGQAIGEALQTLRKSKPRDPTYQAFAYLGDPWTVARF
jgi:hypothetical protein